MRCVGGEKFGRGTRRGYMRSRLLLLAVVVSLVVVAPARAGTYDVYSCRLPDRSPAPANGWVPFASEVTPLGLTATTADACGSGGGLTAALPSPTLVGIEAGWRFTPPPGTRIDGFEVFRTVRPARGAATALGGYAASVGAWPPTDFERDVDERCLAAAPNEPPCDKGLGIPGTLLDQANRYARQGIGAARLTLGIGCWQSFSAGNPACFDPASI